MGTKSLRIVLDAWVFLQLGLLFGFKKPKGNPAPGVLHFDKRYPQETKEGTGKTVVVLLGKDAQELRVVQAGRNARTRTAGLNVHVSIYQAKPVWG